MPTDIRVPDITQGLNDFTVERWRRAWDAVQEVERLSKAVGSLRREFQTLQRDVVLAAITGWKNLGGNKFGYAYEQVRHTNTFGTFEATEGGFTSDNGITVFGNAAFNLVEAGNDGLQVESGGVDTEGEAYPAGFNLVPITGVPYTGSELNDEQVWDISLAPVVMLHFQIGTDAVTRPFFAMMNQHDGTCE